MGVSGAVRQVPCGQCAAEPLEACWPPPGVHVLRLAAAYRHGFISEAQFLSLLADAGVFTASTLVETGEAA